MVADQSPIQFIPMTCSNCGGEMMVSSKLDEAICNYCGRTFLVVKDDKGDVQTALKYIKLAEYAIELDHFDEASNYYDKALELEPDNSFAWYGKARVLGLQRSLTLKKWTLGESNKLFVNAIANAPETERQNLKDKFYMEHILMGSDDAQRIRAECQILKEMIGRTEKSAYNNITSDIWENYNRFCVLMFAIIDVVQFCVREISNIYQLQVYRSLEKIMAALDELDEEIVYSYETNWFSTTPSRYISWDLLWKDKDQGARKLGTELKKMIDESRNKFEALFKDIKKKLSL